MEDDNLANRIHDDYLTCHICYNTYNRPKTLPCLHTFCLDCLQDMVRQRGYDRRGHFPCPLCVQRVDIPTDRGVNGLPTNFMIENLLEIVVNDQNERSDAVDTIGGNDGNRASSSRPGSNTNSNGGSRAGTPVRTVNGSDPTRSTPQPSRPLGDTRNGSAGSRSGVQPSAPPMENRASPQRISSAGSRSSQQRNGSAESRSSQRQAASDVNTPGQGRGGSAGNRPSSSSSRNGSNQQATGQRSGSGQNSSRSGQRLNSGLDRSTSVTYQGLQYRVPRVFNKHSATVCFGQYGSGLVDFTTPVGMTTTGKGDILVSDKRDNRIMTFDLRGHIKWIFNCPGEVSDLAVIHNSAHVIIANGKIGSAIAASYLFTGAHVQTYGNHFGFEKPNGITVNRKNDVIITCAETKKIYVLNHDGKLIHNFTFRGMQTPYYVCSNSNNDVIVSDSDAHTVRVFDRLGKQKLQFGTKDGGKDSLRHPLGVTCDSRDNIVIADSGNRRVVKYSKQGKYLETLVTMATGVMPKMLCLVGDEKLAVLVTGKGFAEIRVYSVKCKASSTCSMM